MDGQDESIPKRNGRTTGMNRFCGIGFRRLGLVAACLLAGCTNTQLQPANTTPLVPSAATQLEVANFVNNVNQLTDEDLATAINLAIAMKDVQAVACFQFIQGKLPDLRRDVAALNAHGGLLTAFEAGHVAVGLVKNGLPDKVAFEMACGPYVLSVVGDLNFVLEQLKVSPVPLPKL